jgi:hypothetical protein
MHTLDPDTQSSYDAHVARLAEHFGGDVVLHSVHRDDYGDVPADILPFVAPTLKDLESHGSKYIVLGARLETQFLRRATREYLGALRLISAMDSASGRIFSWDLLTLEFGRFGRL